MIFESLWLNITVAVGLILALTFDYVTKFFSYWYVRHIPYKTSVPFFGSDYHRVLGLRSNTSEVNTLYKQYPEEDYVGSVKSRIPDLIVRNPDLIKEVLSTEFNHFRNRGLDLDKSQDICLRNNLFYAENEKWTLLRERLEHFLKNVNTVSEERIHRCLSGINGNVNVTKLLSNVLDEVFNIVLLEDVDSSLITSLRQTFCDRSLKNKFYSYLKNIFPSIYTMFGFSSGFHPSPKILDKVKGTGFAKKIRDIFGLKNKDVCIKLKSKEDEFLFGILSSIISEGYVPCLNVLLALLFELAKNPQLQSEARKSTDEYIDALIKETLRLYAPIPVITRKCVKAYKFSQSKVLVDKGITINLPVDAIHKDERHFKESQMFKPERFLNDNALHSSAYLPYGAGPRKCIGEHTSQQIMKNISKTIVQRYAIEITEKTPSKLIMVDYNFGRVLNNDLWLRLKPLEH